MVAKKEGNDACCPICRKVLPVNIANYAKTSVDKCDYTEDEEVTNLSIQQDGEKVCEKKFYWMYQSLDGGWWYYESSHNIEIETAFLKYMKFIDEKDDDTSISCDEEDLLYNHVEIEILQKVYIIDFVLVIQCPKNNPNRVRKIKRVDKYDSSRSKGVAGLRYT
jgi:hypothetical protein